MHVEARGLSFYDSSFASFLKQLWRSDWAESRDATPFDTTFNAAEEREAGEEGVIHPNTFYRSYCATLVCWCPFQMAAQMCSLAYLELHALAFYSDQDAYIA